MNEIRMAAYFQFLLGVIAIVASFIGGGAFMMPLIFIGVAMLGSGYLTMISG